MPANKIDPRIRRTRAMFQDALLQLLKTKRFEKIRVKEIAQQADLSRHAFYSHFETKEDLLFSYVDDQFDMIVQAVKDEFSRGADVELYTLFKISFDLWRSNANVMRYVLQVERKDLVIKRFRDHSVAIIAIYMERRNIQTAQHELSDYIFDFAAGGGFMLIQRWVNDGMIHDSEKMAQLMIEIAPFNALFETS